MLMHAKLSDKGMVANDLVRKITKVSYIMAGSEELDRTFYLYGRANCLHRDNRHYTRIEGSRDAAKHPYHRIAT